MDAQFIISIYIRITLFSHYLHEAIFIKNIIIQWILCVQFPIIVVFCNIQAAVLSCGNCTPLRTARHGRSTRRYCEFCPQAKLKGVSLTDLFFGILLSRNGPNYLAGSITRMFLTYSGRMIGHSLFQRQLTTLA